MALLTETSLESARIIAERVRNAVASTSFESGTQRLNVTVSIGASQSCLDGNTIDEILRVADKRLYSAKHQRRNRVIAA